MTWFDGLGSALFEKLQGASAGDFLCAAVVLCFNAIVVSFTVKRAFRTDYKSLVLESAKSLFQLQIEHPELNKLFYTVATETLPCPREMGGERQIRVQQFTEEQRKLLNFGTIVLNHFEQITVLNSKGELPRGAIETWDPWIRRCAKLPYFLWVFDAWKGEYQRCLERIIEEFRPPGRGYPCEDDAQGNAPASNEIQTSARHEPQ